MSSGNYLVDHYTYTYLYDKNKSLRLLIPFEMSIDQIVKILKELTWIVLGTEFTPLYS